MKKVISFSVFGNIPKYTIGLLKNLELSKTIYPDWEVYVYYNNTVPEDIIGKCKKYDHVILYDMSGYNLPGMFWRFLPENCDRFISRDADSRLSIREKLAVDEWISSGKILHVMRDHPHHDVKIFGGMFGLVINKDFSLKEKIDEWLVDKDKSLFNRWGDVFFLETIYDKYLKENEIISHDSCFTKFPFSKPFPIKMDNYRFIGEIFDEHDNPYYQYKEWINRKEIR